MTQSRIWLIFCLVLAASDQVIAAEPRLPRDNLLLFRDDAGHPQPVKSLEDWGKRRAEILRGMKVVMGKLPGEEKIVPLDLQVEEEFDGGSYVRRLITYVSEPNCRTPAYLLIPKDVLNGKKKAPAILTLHGTNMEVGHGTLVGLGKTPNRGYSPKLAERGYVVLAPNYPIMASYQTDINALGWESGTLKAVWDNMPRPGPVGLASVCRYRAIRRDRAFARRAQFRLHGGIRSANHSRRFELRTRFLSRLLQRRPKELGSPAGLVPDAVHVETRRIQRPVGRDSV